MALVACSVLTSVALMFTADVVGSLAGWGPKTTISVVGLHTSDRGSEDVGKYTYRGRSGHVEFLGGSRVQLHQRIDVTLSPLPWMRSSVFVSGFDAFPEVIVTVFAWVLAWGAAYQLREAFWPRQRWARPV